MKVIGAQSHNLTTVWLLTEKQMSHQIQPSKYYQQGYNPSGTHIATQPIL